MAPQAVVAPFEASVVATERMRAWLAPPEVLPLLPVPAVAEGFPASLASPKARPAATEALSVSLAPPQASPSVTDMSVRALAAPVEALVRALTPAVPPRPAVSVAPLENPLAGLRLTATFERLGASVAAPAAQAPLAVVAPSEAPPAAHPVFASDAPAEASLAATEALRVSLAPPEALPSVTAMSGRCFPRSLVLG